MSPTRPDLLALIGDGFVNDDFAANGNHLRWMFEPSLGFPRYAFCLERRPSVSTPQGQHGTSTFRDAFQPSSQGPAEEVDRLARPRLAVYRPGAKIRVEPEGLALQPTPLVIDFHGGTDPVGQPQVCWVRLWFKVQVPGAWLTATATRAAGGVDEAVDQQNRAYRTAAAGLQLREFEQAAVQQELAAWQEFYRLLGNPEKSLVRPVLPAGSARLLYQTLVAKNPDLYTLVTRTYILSVLRVMASIGLAPGDLVNWKRWMRVQVELQSQTIDRLEISGNMGWLERLEWVYATLLESAPGWQPVGCYPMITSNPDYRARNHHLFPPGTLRSLAERVVRSPLPRGAEPLDARIVPPGRPPTLVERMRRYATPWVNALEPWLDRVLAQSLAGIFHQSETILSSPMTEAGQPGVHIDPKELSRISTSPDREATMEVRPYPFLLAAACAFPVARLLGLAAIDHPPAGVAAWDYRLTGRWRVADWRSWINRLDRDIRVLEEERGTATDARQEELNDQILEMEGLRAHYEGAIRSVVGAAEVGDFELTAYKIGVRPRRHGLFAGPGSLSAAYNGLGVPPDNQAGLPRADRGIEAVARLEWPLRQRSHVIIAEDIPIGSALLRGLAGEAGPFTETLNPVHPDFEVTSAILPAGPELDRGAAGTAVFYDRHVQEGINYRYGVIEVDPFGRWSGVEQTTYRWNYDIEPPEPVHVTAELRWLGDTPGYQLAVRFLWSQDLNPVVDHRFRIYLRRSAPEASESNQMGQWHDYGFRQAPGSLAGSFELSAEAPLGGIHDDMPVEAAREAIMITETGEDGTLEARSYWKYTVTFAGLELDRDALERARAWVGVATYDARHDLASLQVGGPALAEYVLATPPEPAELPGVDTATYADADGFSSYTLRWRGSANQRYTVYRAGERELVGCLVYRGVIDKSHSHRWCCFFAHFYTYVF